MISMAALLMMAVSCKKENKTSDKGEGFRATIESHSGDSKTHLEGLAVKWDNGDAIKVLSNTCTEGADFSTDATSSPALFEATGDLPANFYTPLYTGFYPAAAFSGNQLTLPATQTYVENTFANGANPMAATSNTTQLDFKNVCGVLKLQFYSEEDCQVQIISITSDTGEKLYGTGTVTLTGGIPTLGTLSNGGSTLTLICGEDGIALSKDVSKPTAFYFVVPASTLGTSFTVKVTEIDGKVWTKTANSTQNLIARSKITVLSEQKVTMRDAVIPSSVNLSEGCDGAIYNVAGMIYPPEVEGTYTCEYGVVYSETDDTPTIEEGALKVEGGTATISSEDGYIDFSADITGLTTGTTYYARAYAMIEGIAYSEVIEIVGGSVPLDLPSDWTNGKNPHPFTVANGKQVYFSQGNLQYNAKGASATAASGENVGGTWRFAAHQFEFIGTDNEKASQTYDGWIDLFCWGTSGYNHGADCYQPWGRSDAEGAFHAYGENETNLCDGDGKADWGYNKISNGGNAENMWRTLTVDEADYLMESRLNAESLFGVGIIGGCIEGMIFLPDDWTCPTGLEFKPGSYEFGKPIEHNIYSYSEWSRMETAGAVFLPACGEFKDYGEGFKVYDLRIAGTYWSADNYDGAIVGTPGSQAHTYHSYYGYVTSGGGERGVACAVRLVQDKAPSTRR